MPSKLNLVGQRFGRLVVQDMVRVGRRWQCVCKCDCGSQSTKRSDSLRDGRVVSCGCHSRAISKARKGVVTFTRPASVCSCGDHAFFSLSAGLVTIVSKEDASLARKPWSAVRPNGGGPYAYRKGDGYLHRAICKSANEVDHINGNTLDNRRVNLRSVSRGENCRNTRKRRAGKSAYKGVYWDEAKSNWGATITLNKKRTFLGYFKSEVDAAIAYDKAAIVQHGEFAKTNAMLGLL